jgi:hypothetical protein
MAEEPGGSASQDAVTELGGAAAPALTDGGQARRLLNDALLVLTGAILVFLTWELAIVIPQAMSQPGAVGVDLHSYEEAARAWLNGDTFYHARQLAGPYVLVGADSPFGADILYPPVTLLLLVPFTILPEFLWWAIPAAAISWSIWHLRPAMWSWPAIALLIALPLNVDVWVRGNPVIWVAAALAVGCVITGPAVLVLLKPSLFPFALMGANRRRWWIALGLFTIASLPFGTLWADWVRAILNSNGSLTYSIRDALLLAIPLVAWAARTDRRDARTARLRA